MSESTALALVQQIIDVGIDGCGPLESASELAAQYAGDLSYSGRRSRIEGLIRWESSKNFSSGFVTNLGGILTLPVSIPTAMGASWFVQARLAAAIAVLHGHDPHNDRVRTMALLAVVGDGLKELAKEAGVAVGNKLAMSALSKVSGTVLRQINKAVGFRLITKAGQTGAINLVKIIPLFGAIVGGTIDGATCMSVGWTADELFAA